VTSGLIYFRPAAGFTFSLHIEKQYRKNTLTFSGRCPYVAFLMRLMM